MHKDLFVCLQGQDHSEGSYDENMTVLTISSEKLILLQPDLVCWFIIASQNISVKKMDDCIQGQGHSEGSKCQ